VGATTIKPNVSGYAAGNVEEAVVSGSYTSGAGFSNVFPRPSYQDDAVTAFFAQTNNTIPYYKTTDGKNIGKNGGKYNRAGRAMPDVSANGLVSYDLSTTVLIANKA
jgi:tripeptidyl-peptidase-1